MTEAKSEVETSAKPAETADFLGLVGVSWARFEQLDAISKTILQRIQDERAKELELATALLKCQAPTEAFTLYTKWLSDRTAGFVQDTGKLVSLWTQLCGISPGDKATER